MKKYTRPWFRILIAVLLLLPACAALPGLAGDAAAPPSDWQTVEHGGLVFSLPPGWELGPESWGNRSGMIPGAAGSAEARFEVRVDLNVPWWIDRTEDEYRKDVEGYPYSEVQVESFARDQIDGHQAIRAVLTAQHSEDGGLRGVLYETSVLVGNDHVKVRAACDIRVQEAYEGIFAQIMSSVRVAQAPAEAEVVEAPPTDTPAPAPAPTPDPTPAPDPAPAPAPAEETAVSLSPYFPADKLTLPEGSTVIQVFEGEIDSYTWEKREGGDIEITEVQLPLTKTAAVEYFTEQLNRGGEASVSMDEENPFFLPEAVTGAYPDVSCGTSIYARYAYTLGVRGVTVKLFVKAGEETIYTAYIEAVYARDPSMPADTPAELSVSSLRQVFADMDRWTSEENPAVHVQDAEPVDGFYTYYTSDQLGTTATLEFIGFENDSALQRYAWYREDYGQLHMTFGLIYVTCDHDSDEIRSLIEYVIQGAGG